MQSSPRSASLRPRSRRPQAASPQAATRRAATPQAAPPQAAPPQPAPRLDIIVDSPLWQAQRGVKAVLRGAITEAASMAATTGGELAIVLTNDSAIRTLNRDWRGKDQPTNVLSFPAHNDFPAAAGAPRHRLLGDIVIAYETMAREARAERRPFRHHLAHLAVHGFLHLVGHDHKAEAEAEAMEALEIAVLARLSVPNPYLTRDAEG
jgi:probable rRNA maturation factor